MAGRYIGGRGILDVAFGAVHDAIADRVAPTPPLIPDRPLNRELKDWEQMLRPMPLASSHSHQFPIKTSEQVDLPYLLNRSYSAWGGRDATREELREEYVEAMCHNTYLTWLSRAVGHLYQAGEVNCESWDEISAAIANAYHDPQHSRQLLRERCRLTFAVQDSFWAPGDDLGDPDLFRPAYRINSWVMGYTRGATDHNGNSPWNDPAFAPTSLDEYLQACEAALTSAAGRGCVAFKSALAYDRPLAFDHPDLAGAKRAFAADDPAQVSDSDRLAFGDIVMHHVCFVAGRLGLPLQVHLGLGKLAGTRPMLFEPVIAAYPQVIFDLFHCGYPWCDEVGGLLHNYPNVYADFCWLPLISTTVAIRVLNECLDVAFDADRILWGDDTQTAEEAYGARLAWEYVVARVLAERTEGRLCNVSQADRLAEKLMHGNVEKLYGKRQ